jgi:hypothetical protein
VTSALQVLASIWVIGAFCGVVAVAIDFETNAKPYAKAVFWPVFALIWFLRGVLDALAEEIKK